MIDIINLFVSSSGLYHFKYLFIPLFIKSVKYTKDKNILSSTKTISSQQV